MLSKAAIEHIFREYLPEDVKVMFVNRVEYIRRALDHPFILSQIQIGIYTEESIYTDFLSPACAYTGRRELEVCAELLEDHADGVPDDLTEAYIRAMAMHEAHHFHEEHEKPSTAEQHALTELACIKATKEKNPALEALAQEFERTSPVYVRVYARIAALHQKAMTNQ